MSEYLFAAKNKTMKKNIYNLFNVKKVFFILCLNVFALFDSLTSSGKPFQIKGPKCDKHFWLRVLVLGWKIFREEFLVTVLF